jgi:protein tyrosine phosphatase (PTP) superfamily phosphohydrolase (DUF442 family)
MQKLLQAWVRAIAEAECAEARAYCATPGARARAAYEARQAERRAARLEQAIRRRYGVDPVEMLRNGEIK